MAGKPERIRELARQINAGMSHQAGEIEAEPILGSLKGGLTQALPQYAGQAVLLEQRIASTPVSLIVADGQGSRTPRWLTGGFSDATGLGMPLTVEVPATKPRSAKPGREAVAGTTPEEMAAFLEGRKVRKRFDPKGKIVIFTDGIDKGQTVNRITEGIHMALPKSRNTPIDVVTAHMEGVVPMDAPPGADPREFEGNLLGRIAELEEIFQLNGGHVYAPQIKRWEAPAEHPALYLGRGRDVPTAGPTVGRILAEAMAREELSEASKEVLVPFTEMVMIIAGRMTAQLYKDGTRFDGMHPEVEEGIISSVANSAIDQALQLVHTDAEESKPTNNALIFPFTISSEGRRSTRWFDSKKTKERINQQREEDLAKAVEVITSHAMQELLINPAAVNDILVLSEEKLSAYLKEYEAEVKNQKEYILRLKKSIVSNTLQYRMGISMLAAMFEYPQGVEDTFQPTELPEMTDLALTDLINYGSKGAALYAKEKKHFLSAVLGVAINAYKSSIDGDVAWKNVQKIDSDLDTELDIRGYQDSYMMHGSSIYPSGLWDLMRAMSKMIPIYTNSVSAHSMSSHPLDYDTPYTPPRGVDTLSWNDVQHGFFVNPSTGVRPGGVPAQAKVTHVDGYRRASLGDQAKETNPALWMDKQIQVIKKGFEHLGYTLPDSLSTADVMTYIGAMFLPILAPTTLRSLTVDKNTGLGSRIEEVRNNRERKLAIKTKQIAAQEMENLLDHPENLANVLDAAESKMKDYMREEGQWIDDPDDYILRLKKGVVSSSLQYYVTMAMLSDMLGDPHSVVETLYKNYPPEEGKYVAFALDGEGGFTFDPFYEDGRHNFLSAVSEWATQAYDRTVGSNPLWQNVEKAKLELTAELTDRGQRESYAKEPTPNVPPTVWSIMKNMNSVLMLLQPPLTELNQRAETEAMDSLAWSSVQLPLIERPGDLVGLAGITASTLGEITPPNPAPEVTVYMDSDSGDIDKYGWSGRTAELIEEDYGGICFGFRALHRTRATSRLWDSINRSLDPLGVSLPVRTSAVQAMGMVGALLQPMLAADYPNLHIPESTSLAHQLAADKSINYK